MPAFISGDDAFQFAFGISRSEVIGDVSETGHSVFRGPNTDEVTEAYQFDVAGIVSDRSQASLTLPLIRKSVRLGEATPNRFGAGDVAFGYAYEAWPEWTYSQWKPRGYVFSRLTVPTAHSIYDSGSPSATDAFGTGFYRLSTGVLLLKNWGTWDAAIIPEIHYSISRTFVDPNQNSVRVTPGFGASSNFSLGYHISEYRLGFRIQPSWAQARVVETDDRRNQTSQEWVWNAGLDLSYAMGSEWSLTGYYSDQTLFGPARNTTLSRAVGLNFQKRWPR
jgi:hypothetical protein